MKSISDVEIAKVKECGAASNCCRDCSTLYHIATQSALINVSDMTPHDNTLEDNTLHGALQSLSFFHNT